MQSSLWDGVDGDPVEMVPSIVPSGYTPVANAMKYVDHGAAELERLEFEKAAEKRRNARE